MQTKTLPWGLAVGLFLIAGAGEAQNEAETAVVVAATTRGSAAAPTATSEPTPTVLQNIPSLVKVTVKVNGPELEGRKAWLVDGEPTADHPTERFVRSSSEVVEENEGSSYKIDLGANYEVQQIVLVPRQDPAESRYLSHFRVRLICDPEAETRTTAAAAPEALLPSDAATADEGGSENAAAAPVTVAAATPDRGDGPTDPCGDDPTTWNSGRQFTDGTDPGIDPVPFEVGALGRWVEVRATAGMPHGLQLAEILIQEAVPAPR